MTYIIVAAGMGTRLHPYTQDCPKASYKLDAHTTLLSHLVRGLKKHDPEAEVVVCTGFCAERIKEEVPEAICIWNPFYAVTNSLSTLWFARDYLDRAQVTIIDGDIIAEDRLLKEVYCCPVDRPTSMMDSSRASSGDYCVLTDGEGRVITMGKGLPRADGEYANVTKLDGKTARLLKDKMEQMLKLGRINDWMETALNQLVFEEGVTLYTRDIAGYRWSEMDSAADLPLVRAIYQEDQACRK
ncbi:MAG: hypothetical protein IJF41_03845 [Clostridia bacterium]|nr:hypothetical protein [Clostridia bacterium]